MQHRTSDNSDEKRGVFASIFLLVKVNTHKPSAQVESNGFKVVLVMEFDISCIRCFITTKSHYSYQTALSGYCVIFQKKRLTNVAFSTYLPRPLIYFRLT